MGERKYKKRKIKETRRQLPLDVYFKNTADSKTDLTSPLIEGTLARTEKGTEMPHLDELTHHLIVVSAASLRFNSREATLAALIHDYFKPVFDFGQTRWRHLITDDELYSQILSVFKESVDVNKVANISRWHHPKKEKDCNEICQIEQSGALSGLEVSIPFSLPKSQEFIITEHLRVAGPYRMFLLAHLRRKLIKMLSKKYSERFQEILGVSRIRYEYRPLNGVSTIEEAAEYIKKENWKIEIDNETMIIPLPSRFHRDLFYFEYYEESNVVIDVDENAKKIRGIRIPFGAALSTVYLTSSRDAYLLYVGAGFEQLALKDVIKEMLNDLKKMLDDYDLKKKKQKNEKQKSAFEQIDLDKIASSLTGRFNNDEACIFCGEPGEPIAENEKISSVLEDKFTDRWLLLRNAGVACPACKLGFEIEELFRPRRRLDEYIPYEALVSNVKILHDVPIFKETEFIRSISSKIWLELLSEIYYSLYFNKTKDSKEGSIKKEEEWIIKFFLNPTVLVYPYEIEITPQAMTVALGYQKKKFILQSGLHSSVVFPGNEKDLLPEEFLVLRKVYASNPELGIYLLQKLRDVYSPIFGVPEVKIKGGGSRARKRKH
ncbi:MAG: hypothetical protein PWQ58_186 [Archaeoglobaceae archaeon]|nr:hypothetical protein [Archaeoglobaceae archaeon]